MRRRAVKIDDLRFVQALCLEMAKALEDTVGSSDAEAYFRLVGLSLAESFSKRFGAPSHSGAPDRDRLRATLNELLTDLFDGRIIAETEAQLVLKGCRCPLGASVKGRTSLCHVTSALLGSLVAQSQGYASVHQPKTFAKSDRECLTVIDLKPQDHGIEVEEYFRDDRCHQSTLCGCSTRSATPS